jgi:hypothetical protein
MMTDYVILSPPQASLPATTGGQRLLMRPVFCVARTTRPTPAKWIGSLDLTCAAFRAAACALTSLLARASPTPTSSSSMCTPTSSQTPM